MKIKNSSQQLILKVLSTRPVLYNPDLAKALKSVKASILLSQLLYWNGKGKDINWIYKTIQEIYDETALSREEQDTAIRICKAAKVIKIKLAGVPATRHFKIDIEKITELILTSNNKV